MQHILYELMCTSIVLPVSVRLIETQLLFHIISLHNNYIFTVFIHANTRSSLYIIAGQIMLTPLQHLFYWSFSVYIVLKVMIKNNTLCQSCKVFHLLESCPLTLLLKKINDVLGEVMYLIERLEADRQYAEEALHKEKRRKRFLENKVDSISMWKQEEHSFVVQKGQSTQMYIFLLCIVMSCIVGLLNINTTNKTFKFFY